MRFGRGASAGVWLGLVFGVVLACNDSARGRAPGASGSGEAGAIDAGGAAGAGNDSSTVSGAPALPDALPPPCNGTAVLCDKSYSELAFLGTHFSFAGDSTWATPTQGRSLRDQLLIGGVRALELEVHLDHGALAVCAGSCSQGSQALVSALREVATFLDGNRTDVLTLVLRVAAPIDTLVTAFDSQGLVALSYSQTQGKPWPTLQEMIDADRRLVVFVGAPLNDESGASGDGGSAGASPISDTAFPKWMHPLSDWAWETAPDEATDCVIAEGDASRPLAILNDYVPGETASGSSLVNAHAPEAVAARMRRCADDRGRTPSIVFVDFAEVGDPNGGPQIVNGIR